MKPMLKLYRDRGLKPAYFGLGFIQLKIDDQHRMHFWHPDISAITAQEDIHDHRYTFRSEILSGRVEHLTYTFHEAPNGSHEMYEVSCDSADPGPRGEAVRGSVNRTAIYSMDQGCTYVFKYGQFHQFTAERAVTLVKREPVMLQYARVIRPVGAPHVCPFSKTLPDAELWRLMNEAFL